MWLESLVKALDEFCDGLLVGQRIEQNELRTCSSHISLALPSLALAFPPFSFRSFSSPACAFLACLSPCLSLLSLASPFPSLPLRSVPDLPFPLLAFPGVPYCPFPPCLVFLSPKGHQVLASATPEKHRVITCWPVQHQRSTGSASVGQCNTRAAKWQQVWASVTPQHKGITKC